MIFDIDESDTDSPDTDEKAPQPVPEPIIQEDPTPMSASQKRKEKSQQVPFLPGSFIALRPASLPAPSNIRPPLRSRLAQNTPNHEVHVKRNKRRDARSSATTENFDRPLKLHEIELRKLVAADIPSHRGAWNRSEVWKAFGRNGYGKSRLGSASRIIEEDDEDGTDDSGEGSNTTQSYNDPSNWRNYRPTNLSSSLPLAMGPIRKLSGDRNGAQSRKDIHGSACESPARGQGIVFKGLGAVWWENNAQELEAGEFHKRTRHRSLEKTNKSTSSY